MSVRDVPAQRVWRCDFCDGSDAREDASLPDGWLEFRVMRQEIWSSDPGVGISPHVVSPTWLSVWHACLSCGSDKALPVSTRRRDGGGGDG